jgi:hypothetical protein
MIYVSRRTEWRRRPDAVDAVDADADADAVARAVEDAVEDGIRAVDDGYQR